MITRKILEQLADADCHITISTKSSLILRDLEFLKRLPYLKVSFSINTLNESFRRDMEEYKEIIASTQDFVMEYWFENLNLRGTYKKDILNYISINYPDLLQEYQRIYIDKDMTYWHELAEDLEDYCNKLCVKYENYFYHEKLVKEKKKS